MRNAAIAALLFHSITNMNIVEATLAMIGAGALFLALYAIYKDANAQAHETDDERERRLNREHYLV